MPLDHTSGYYYAVKAGHVHKYACTPHAHAHAHPDTQINVKKLCV